MADDNSNYIDVGAEQLASSPLHEDGPSQPTPEPVAEEFGPEDYSLVDMDLTLIPVEEPAKTKTKAPVVTRPSLPRRAKRTVAVIDSPSPPPSKPATAKRKRCRSASADDDRPAKRSKRASTDDKDQDPEEVVWQPPRPILPRSWQDQMPLSIRKREVFTGLYSHEVLTAHGWVNILSFEVVLTDKPSN